MGNILKFLLGALLAASPAFAEVPDWQQTFDQDMQGPRVDLTGQIVSRFTSGEQTCFVVEHISGRFIACNSGYFDPARFGPGTVLNAKGNLGAAVARNYGGHVYDYPLVAGALISPKARPDYAYPDYYGHYYGHPFYDPFYGPFYHPHGYGPYFGTGIFFHIH